MLRGLHRNRQQRQPHGEGAACRKPDTVSIPPLQVDVDVYRRAAGARQEPLPGAACFTAESLAAWRELNTAADFTEVAAEIHNLASSLPLLLHHKVGCCEAKCII